MLILVIVIILFFFFLVFFFFALLVLVGIAGAYALVYVTDRVHHVIIVSSGIGSGSGLSFTVVMPWAQ